MTPSSPLTFGCYATMHSLSVNRLLKNPQDLFFSSCLTWLVPAGQRLPWHEFPLSWTTCNYQVSVPQTIPYRFNCDPLMTCNDDGSALCE